MSTFTRKYQNHLTNVKSESSNDIILSGIVFVSVVTLKKETHEYRKEHRIFRNVRSTALMRLERDPRWPQHHKSRLLRNVH